MFESIAIVGATGAVGQIIRRLLVEREFPHAKITFLASARSAGSTIEFGGQQHTVQELKPEAFDDIDLAIGSTPDPVAKDFVPWAKERGCVVVDESGYWRMDPNVPLVVPEVNPEAALSHQGVIASPNCSTTQMVLAMKPLHDAGRISRVVVSTYQATSGAGVAGQEELVASSQAVAQWRRSPAHRLRLPDCVQLDSADRFGEARRLHLRRDEDGLGNPEDLRQRVDQGLPHMRPRAGEQLPQREHFGGD